MCFRRIEPQSRKANPMLLISRCLPEMPFTSLLRKGVFRPSGQFLFTHDGYQTNWFRVLCVAAAIGLLWLMYHRRMRTVEQRQQFLERQKELLEQNQALLERHQTEITALNDRLMKAQEEERTRIAGDLHDGVLQRISLDPIRKRAKALGDERSEIANS